MLVIKGNGYQKGRPHLVSYHGVVSIESLWGGQQDCPMMFIYGIYHKGVKEQNGFTGGTRTTYGSSGSGCSP